jgi:hypothetical protein
MYFIVLVLNLLKCRFDKKPLLAAVFFALMLAMFDPLLPTKPCCFRKARLCERSEAIFWQIAKEIASLRSQRQHLLHLAEFA